MKKRGQKHAAATSREISVSSKQKHNRLSLEAPTCPAPRAGRQQGWRCPDVGKPACAHGRTKLIAQVFNGFGNSSVIFKAKILMHLAIMRISDISVINDITDIKVIKRIKRMKS